MLVAIVIRSYDIQFCIDSVCSPSRTGIPVALCRFTARGEVPRPLDIERIASDAQNEFLPNDSPFYFGRPPLSVFAEPAAPVVLADVRVHPTQQVTAGNLAARLAQTKAAFSTAMLR